MYLVSFSDMWYNRRMTNWGILVFDFLTSVLDDLFSSPALENKKWAFIASTILLVVVIAVHYFR